MKRLCVVLALLVLPGCDLVPTPTPTPTPSPSPTVSPSPTPTPTPTPAPVPEGAWDCNALEDLAGQFVHVDEPWGDTTKVLAVLRKRPAGLRSLSRAPGVRSVEELNDTGIAVIEMDPNSVSSLAADPNILFLQEIGTKRVQVEWGLDRIDQRALPLDLAYSARGDGAGYNIAIVDTGVSPHSDFGNRLVVSPCFTAHSGGCDDGHGHGTHVAGTAAGATYGVAKKAAIWRSRVLGADGSGSDLDVIRGIEWVIDNVPAPRVINMSLGGGVAPALDAAVCRAIEAGVVTVVAAGNDDRNAKDDSPARVFQAITVGASDEEDGIAWFSNWGPILDIYAPGVDVRSAQPGGGSAVFSGTSMATPHVAGAVAVFDGDVGALLEAATPGRLPVFAGSPNLLLYDGAP